MHYRRSGVVNNEISRSEYKQVDPSATDDHHNTHRVLAFDELATFRTYLCDAVCKGSCTLPDRCPNSHCLTWQRRNPMIYFYSATLCPEIEFVRRNNRMTLIRKCMRGRSCPYAHSKEEELYHPMVYKTKLCKALPGCQRYYCPFAHCTSELKPRLTIDEYKTLLRSQAVSFTDLCIAPDNNRGIRSDTAKGLSSPSSQGLSITSTEACTQSDMMSLKKFTGESAVGIYTPQRGAQSPVSSPTIYFQTAPPGGPFTPLRNSQSESAGLDSEFEGLWLEIQGCLNQNEDDPILKETLSPASAIIHQILENIAVNASLS